MSLQPSAAAPGPAAPPSGAPSAPSSGEGKEPGEGGDFDFRNAFKAQQKTLGETSQRLSRVMQEFDSHKDRTSKDSEILGKIKEVFAPSEKTAPNPVADWEGQLDYYIAQAVEAEKKGAPIPLTANLAISHYKSLIENYNEKQELMQTIKQMGQKLETLENPQHQINNQAYATLDNHIKRGLDSLFGPGEEHMPQKVALFQAVGSQIASALQELMQKNPKRWDMIRRDPGQLADIANRVLKMNIPPKAVQMLEEENLRNTEMPLAELRQAFKEAGEIEDPKERQRVQKNIREEILTRMYQSGKIRVSK